MQNSQFTKDRRLTAGGLPSQATSPYHIRFMSVTVLSPDHQSTRVSFHVHP